MVNVDLDAEDNGSGKLVEYYKEIGFVVTQAIKGFDVEMEAPMSTVIRHAPSEWVQELIPKDFDPWGFLQPMGPQPGKSLQDPVRTTMMAADVPWSWTWNVTSPGGARIDAKIGLNQSDRVLADVVLRNWAGEELACARGSVRIRHQTLRVVGWGRSRSQPVHESIRGLRMYTTGDAATSEGAQSNTTSAVAVLGALAAVARWFATNTVHLTSTGDTSGKLRAYLSNLGFEEPGGEDAAKQRAVQDPVNLVMSCEDLADNWCPPQWREHLPPDSGLSMLVGLCRR